jgi:hypothetical protein
MIQTHESVCVQAFSGVAVKAFDTDIIDKYSRTIEHQFYSMPKLPMHQATYR